MRRFLPLVALLVVALGASALALRHHGTAPKTPTRPLRLTALRATTATRNGLVWVELRARLCAPHPLHSLPTAIGIAHFLVIRGKWTVVRTTEQRVTSSVSLGENWGGKPCGLFEADDPIPPADSVLTRALRPQRCYGVELALSVDGEHATRRAYVSCGRSR